MRLTGWNGRNRVALETGNSDRLGNGDPASAIPIPPIESEAPWLVQGTDWTLIDWEESKKYTWSGVITVNGQIRHLFV